jgi:hypothetical protein
LAAILNIRQFAQSTYTGEALQNCLDMYTEANGMRPSADGVTKLIIVLTDGLSNGYISPKDSANKLKQKSISIFSIGVGSGVNYNELNDIASDNNIFLLNNYNAVLMAIEDVKLNSCLEPAVIPGKTNTIEVSKDSYKYFAYPMSSSGNQTLYMIVETTAGSVRAFFSFDDKNPNDIAVSSKKKRDTSSIQQFALPKLDTNSTKLYIGIKGLSDVNNFTIEITNTSRLLLTSKANKLDKAFSCIFLTFIILFHLNY